MARPIKDTPVLKGKAARKFREMISDPKPVSKEELEKAKAAFEALKKIANFPI